MPGVLRRAIVVFVPEPVGGRLDEIRTRWDPVMRDRIGSHITLIHDVTDHAAAVELVAVVASSTTPFAVRLGRADRWGPSAWGIYLHVDDPLGAIASMQSRLAVLEEPRWARVAFRSHVTLVHSRTTEPAVAERAWAALDGFDPGWPVEVRALDVIELEEPGWHTVERFELVPAAPPDGPDLDREVRSGSNPRRGAVEHRLFRDGERS
jgi:2'-5' RNA ligase